MALAWNTRKKFCLTCEKCKTSFESRKISARFCSSLCSSSQIDYIKVGEKCKLSWTKKQGTEAQSLMDFSSRTVQKVLKRMKVGCSNCGWNKTTCDIHHINGRKGMDANKHTNLCLLCPNCHRMAHEGILDKLTLINLQDQLGESWRLYFYGESTRKIKKKLLYNVCQKCFESFCCKDKTRKYCSVLCSRESRRKIQWPSISELLERLSTSNYSKLAKELGVSDNAIRKRIKNHYI